MQPTDAAHGAPELSVVVPVFNEQEVLPLLRERLFRVLPACCGEFEVVFVDDGSADESPAFLFALAASDPRVRVLRFSRNFGHQAAVTAGIEHARGRAVVIIDADLQDPPEVIPDLMAQWRRGYEVVSAVRTDRPGESAVRLMAIKVFYRILKRIASVDTTPDVGDFRLLDRRVADALNRLPERNRYVRGLIRWLGFRHVEVPYKRDKRWAGATKYPYRKLVQLALNGVTAFSTIPLHLVAYAGFAVFALSVGLVAFAIVGRLVGASAPPGWASVFVAVTALSGIQLTALGILGLYVGRIFEEVKRRPLYVLASDTAEPGVASSRTTRAASSC